ncbi:MAG: DUF58 domain-containing protein, partial [Firmicutes bacterium]|nr:DUF58 domain-containing protein [Bacillota bacterium]
RRSPWWVERVFPGEEVDLQVAITNRKPFPLPWLTYADEIHSDLLVTRGRIGPHYKPQRQLLLGSLSIRWYERVTRHYRIRAQKRGFFPLGPVSLQVEDFFGLQQVSKELPGTDHLLVYPRTFPLEELGVPPGAPFGEGQGGERIFEDPALMMGTREYTHLDPFNRIDWKATARAQALQVRVFEPSITTALALFLNVNTFRHPWEGVDEDLLEKGISLAASLVLAAYDLGYLVGLYANGPVPGRGSSLRLPPRRSPEQIGLLLEGLAMVTGPGFLSVEQLVEESRSELGWGTTLVLVTPFLDEELRCLLQDLREAGHQVRVFLLSEASAENTADLDVFRIGRDWPQS